MTPLKKIKSNLISEYKKIHLDNVYSLGMYPVFDTQEDCVQMYIVNEKTDIYDGLILTYYKYDNTFEVAEYQAGKNNNELRIYTKTKSLIVALKSLLRGNKKRITIEKW